MSVFIRMHSEHKNKDEWLHMSNAGMDIFLTTLALSGSKLAETQKQKEIILWIAEHDDVIRGRGFNDFDISDFPWNYDDFEEELKFLLKVIDGVKQKIGWETLNYDPNEEILYSNLVTFSKLLTGFNKKYITTEAYLDWKKEKENPKYSIPVGFPKCAKHSILLHYGGCIACNNE